MGLSASAHADAYPVKPVSSTGRAGTARDPGRVSPPLSIKEVFQPHLPVRLPCYDLAPVTCFTLGRSSLGGALQVPQAPMA